MNNKIPSPSDFFLNTPLYTSYKISSDDYDSIKAIEFFTGSVVTYCAKCNQDPSVFQSKHDTYPSRFGLREIHPGWSDYKTFFEEIGDT